MSDATEIPTTCMWCDREGAHLRRSDAAGDWHWFHRECLTEFVMVWCGGQADAEARARLTSIRKERKWTSGDCAVWEPCARG